MSKQHEVQSLNFKDEWMLLVVDGQAYQIPIAQASIRLAQASEWERQLYRIAPSGYGIHWMTLDEDLPIQGLLAIAIAQSQAS